MKEVAKLFKTFYTQTYNDGQYLESINKIVDNDNRNIKITFVIMI